MNNSQKNAAAATAGEEMNMLDVITQNYDARKEPVKEALEELKLDRKGKEVTLVSQAQTLTGNTVIYDPRSAAWKKVVGKIVEYVLLLLIALGEYNFNKISFQIFGMSTISGNRTAVVIGVVLCILAASIGYAFCKAFFNAERKFLWIVVVLLPVAIGGMYGLSIAREKFMAVNSDGLMSMTPVTQTIFTFIIFAAGILVTFFGERTHKNPEVFKAYCDGFQEYDILGQKIKQRQSELDALNAELDQKLKEEGKNIEGQSRLKLSRNEAVIIPPTRSKAKPKIALVTTMTGLLDEFKTVQNKETIPFQSKFSQKFVTWAEKVATIEQEMTIKKMDPSSTFSFHASKLMLLEGEIVTLEANSNDSSSYEKGIWRLAKDIFSHLSNQAENES